MGSGVDAKAEDSKDVLSVSSPECISEEGEDKDVPNLKFPSAGTMKSPPMPSLPGAPLKSKLYLGNEESELIVTLFVGTENDKWSFTHVPEAPVCPQEPKLNKGRGEMISSLVSSLFVVTVSDAPRLCRNTLCFGL